MKIGNSKKKRIWIVAAAVLIILGLAATAAASIPEIFGKGNQEAQTASVTLPENLTTGYAWHMDVEKEGIARVVDDSHQEGSSGMVGSAGARTLVFGGLAKGETTVTFRYFRTWEGEGETIDTRKYLVTVDKDLNVKVTEKQ